MPSPFSNIFAIDPLDLTKVAALAEVVIFAPGDEAMAPLVLTDVTGVPLGNPIMTNEFGFGPAFIADLDQVAWSGGGLSGLMESYAGVKNAAVAAQGSSTLSAASAEASRLAAELAAEGSAAAAAEQVELELAENRAVMTQASLDVTASQAAAVAAAGLVDAPAGDAVLAAISHGGAARGELSAAIEAKLIALNAAEFGLVGDDGADDTAALQAAFDAGTLAGMHVFVPDGVYKITAPLRSTGDGLQVTLSRGATIRRHFLNNMFINGANKTTVGGHSNITIRGGTWDANGLDFPDWGSVWCLGKASNITIADVHAKNVCKSHIVELAGVTDVKMDITFSGYHDPTGTRDYAEALQVERMTKTGFPAFDIEDNTPCKRLALKATQLDPDPGYARWPVFFGSHYITPNLPYSEDVTVTGDAGFCTKHVALIQNVKNVTLDRVRGSSPIGVVVEGNGIIADHQTLLRDCDILSTNSHGLLLDKVRGVKVDGGTIDGKTNAVFLSNASGLNLTGRVTLIAQTLDAIVASGVAGSPASADINLNGVRILKARIGIGKIDPYADGLVCTMTDVSVGEITNHFMNVPKNARVRASNVEIKKMPNSNRVFNFTVGSPAVAAATNTLYPPNVTTFSNPVGGEHEMLSQNVMRTIT